MLSTLTPLTLAEAQILSSWWKPFLILLPILPWAWVVSRVYDKHSNMFALPRRKWNIFHMACALVGFIACVLVPTVIGPNHGAFFAGWGVLIICLAVSLVAYPLKANKDDRVTAKHRITWTYVIKSTQAEKKAKDTGPKSSAKVALAIKAADDKGKFTFDVPVPQPETPELETRLAAEQMYTLALASRASQIDIQPATKDTYQVSVLIDGVRQNQGDPLPVAAAARLMDFWRGAARMDVNDRRRRQNGALQIDVAGARNILAVSSLGVSGGMRTTLLFDPEKAVTRKSDALGLLPSQLEELKKIVADSKGVVLLAGKADGGRTTTLYAVTRMHDAYTQNVQTLEMEPQGTIEGVRTNKFDPAADAAAGAPGGAEYSTLLRSILRRDPQVVSVAELPDAATAKEIVKSDQERTRIYVSIPAGDALTAIAAFLKQVGDPRQVGTALHGVLAQRMVRKLCTNCRVAYPPTPEMLKKLGLPEGKIQQLFKKGGQVLIKNKPEVCPVCKGSGYVGQEGIFEVFFLDKEERDLISTGNLQGLRAAFRKRSLPVLQHAAIRKAVDGVTSVEEVLRVTADPVASPGGAPAAPPANGAQAKPAAPNPAG